MPEAFEKYFYKIYTAMNQTLLDYCTQSGQALRELSKYRITLPDEVAGRLLMRRADLTKGQAQLIQTTVGTETTIEKVEKALYPTLGQNHNVASPAKFNMCGRWKSDRAHFAEDEVYYEDEDEYNDDEYLALMMMMVTCWNTMAVVHTGKMINWIRKPTYYGSTAAEDMPNSDAVFDTEEF